jgi:tetratricopeptide (TPR) repeat protein
VYEGDALSTANEAEPAYALYQESMAIRAKLWGPQSVKLARERYQLAMGLVSQGRLSQALRELAQAEKDMASTMGANHTNTLVITLQRGRLEVQIDMNPEGMKRLRHAADLLIQRSKDIDPRTLFEAVHSVGEALQIVGDIESAGAYLKKALKTYQSLHGQLPVSGQAESDLAANLQDLGEYSRAHALLTVALQRVSLNLPSQHGQVRALKDNLAALAMAESMSNGEPLSTVDPEIVGPAELIAAGRPVDALNVAQKQWQQVASMSKGDQFALTRYIANDQLARALAATGRCDLATEHFHEALFTLQHAHPQSPYLMLTRSRLGDCEILLGHINVAKRLAALVKARLDSPPRLGRHLRIEAEAFIRKAARL